VNHSKNAATAAITYAHDAACGRCSNVRIKETYR
jgi:hypothetical protein